MSMGKKQEHISDSRGELEKMAEQQRKKYERLKKAHGEEHPATMDALYDLARAYADIDEKQKALELYEELYAQWSRLYDRACPMMRRMQAESAKIYFKMGEYKKAAKIYEIIADYLSSQASGDEKKAAPSLLGMAASAYSLADEKQKALELSEKVYELRRSEKGEADPETIDALRDLARAYADMGEYERALELMEQAYERRRDIMGPQHPDTITELYHQGVIYEQMRNYAKAAEVFEQVYTLRLKYMGEEDPATMAIKQALDVARKKSEVE